MISLANITLEFGDRKLFDALNWTIPDGSRIGLIGANGTGKTTLFRLLLGTATPTGGTVSVPKNRTIGHLPQEPTHLGEQSLLKYLKSHSGVEALERDMHRLQHAMAETPASDPAHRDIVRRYEHATTRFAHMDGYGFEARATAVLHGLGFKDREIGNACNSFSGGWQMRICLAALLLSEPDLLLLDEPTNHLDTESMEWLEGFLKDYRGSIITIAHDRVFLDKIARRIALLDRGHITVYTGNYAAFLEQKARRDEQLEREAQRHEQEVARVQRFVDRFRAKNTKASQVRSRIKMLEKMTGPEAVRAEGRNVHMEFPPCRKSGKEVLAVAGLAKRYGDLQVFAGLNFTIYRGEKVGLVGVNGAGKSTLLRLLSRTEEPTAGEARHGANVEPAYFSQITAENVGTGNRTVWEEANAVSSQCTSQEIRNLLGSFLFSGDDIDKPVAVLSGGEKSRLALLKTLLRAPNMLILDEPTNHLDMRTREVFQEALTEYHGTVLLVSHDRFFLDNVVNRILELRDGRHYDYYGNYTFFMEKRAMDAATPQTPADAPTPAESGDKRGRRIREKSKQQERYLRQLQRRRSQAEERIMELETRKQELEEQLCAREIYADPDKAGPLGAELDRISTDLDGCYEEWNALSDRVAAQEKAM